VKNGQTEKVRDFYFPVWKISFIAKRINKWIKQVGM